MVRIWKAYNFIHNTTMIKLMETGVAGKKAPEIIIDPTNPDGVGIKVDVEAYKPIKAGWRKDPTNNYYYIYKIACKVMNTDIVTYAVSAVDRYDTIKDLLLMGEVEFFTKIPSLWIKTSRVEVKKHRKRFIY